MNKSLQLKDCVVFLATFPPRECGIATFTQDLLKSFDGLYAPVLQSRVVAMNSQSADALGYGKKVIGCISQQQRDEYAAMAKKINGMPEVRLVSVQHEFGIFGGEQGEYLLDFLNVLDRPVVVTMHTVLPQPHETMKRVVQGMAARASKLVVMTERSKHILMDDYAVPEDRIAVIPHGIHPLPFGGKARAKAALRLTGKTVLTTFGLLSQGKGIEYVIRSLPEVVKKNPHVVYEVIGATHPEILKREGEQYRTFLMSLVRELGLDRNVVFHNKYAELSELLQYLKATDVYLSTSLDPNQAVSGTLSYAAGTGCPVVSTEFAQARELVTPDTGILVPMRQPEQYAAALLRLLENEALLDEMSKNAYIKTRTMTWPNVAMAYMNLFRRLLTDLQHAPVHVPPVKLDHVREMTDGFGIFQFARLTQPDSGFGYTLDDNARALVALCWHYKKFRSRSVFELIKVYLRFIEYSAGADGYYSNYAGKHHEMYITRNNAESKGDPSARALYALAVCATTAGLPKTVTAQARRLFFGSIRAKVRFLNPKSAAFFIKALSAWHEKFPSPKIASVLREHAVFLLEEFSKSSGPDWQWFEPQLSYSNATIPEALALAHHCLGPIDGPVYWTAAVQSLEFLIKQTFFENWYTPIGQQGWFVRGRKRALFDQQPEDTSAMVLALATFYSITQDQRYRRLMYRAFYWFLGENMLGRMVYDESTGGCYDGVGEHAVNLNQGAESTVCYLLARLALES